jgi:hypothetical protein
LKGQTLTVSREYTDLPSMPPAARQTKAKDKPDFSS